MLVVWGNYALTLKNFSKAYIKERKIIKNNPSGTGMKTISSSQESS
jgi:hypothetical protein